MAGGVLVYFPERASMRVGTIEVEREETSCQLSGASALEVASSAANSIPVADPEYQHERYHPHRRRSDSWTWTS